MIGDTLGPEALLRALQSVAIGVAVFDAAGKVRFASSGAERCLGISAAAAAGRHYLELPGLSAGGAFDAAFRGVRSGGAPRRVASLRVELSPCGYCVVALWRDPAIETTSAEARRASADAREHEARVRRQLEQLVVRHEQSEQRTARLYLASAELARAATPHAVGSLLLGAARDAGADGGVVLRSGVGLELLASTDPALEARARRACESFLDGGEGLAMSAEELVLALTLGDTPSGAVYLRYPEEPHDEQRFFVRALCAISAHAIERASMLVRERHLRAEAEAVNRAKDDFVAALSHELRTPLSAILGWAHLLREGTLAESEHARAYAAIERNARVQAQLVDDLLDVSRIATGKLHIERAPVSPAEAIRSAIDTLRHAIDAKQLALEAELPEVGEVLADPQRLQQIVWNLLSNAVKFTPRGGRVRAVLRRADGHVEIEVTDEGKGIDPGFVPHLFRRFSQAESPISRQHGGLGLGLAITRHLVEMHGGSIRAFSEGEGKGARFVVRLPLESAVGAAPDVRARVDRTEPPRLDGVRVLVVEDEPDTRELLRTLLERLGADVATAASCVEALRAFDDAPPDVLLSDIGMPEKTGYDLIREVRRRDGNAGGTVPAAALTAYAGADDRRRAVEAGFQLHLAKPVDPDRLAEVVASLVASAPGAA